MAFKQVWMKPQLHMQVRELFPRNSLQPVGADTKPKTSEMTVLP